MAVLLAEGVAGGTLRKETFPEVLLQGSMSGGPSQRETGTWTGGCLGHPFLGSWAEEGLGPVSSTPLACRHWAVWEVGAACRRHGQRQALRPS